MSDNYSQNLGSRFPLRLLSTAPITDANLQELITFQQTTTVIFINTKSSQLKIDQRFAA